MKESFVLASGTAICAVALALLVGGCSYDEQPAGNRPAGGGRPSTEDKAGWTEDDRDAQQRFIAGSNNLKHIGLAIHMFSQEHKTFPPAYKADPNGKPLLSWRVLILPHLDGGGVLYNQFHLDEPWDSDHNKQLIAQMPAVYADPDSKVADKGKTNYLAVRNSRSVICGKDGMRFADVTDSIQETIMTVEVSDEAAAVWTKPDDFEYDEAHPLRGLGGLRPSGCFWVGFADASVEKCEPSIDPMRLKAFFTRNGGEPVKHWPKL